MSSIGDYITARVALPLGWSEDGARLLIQSNAPGTLQLFERAADGELRQLTDEKEPVSGRYLPGSDRLLAQHDDGGNERQQLFVLDPDGGLEPLVVDPAWIHLASDVSRDGRLVAYRTNRRNGTDFDVVVRDLATGSESTIYDGGGYAVSGDFSPDGRWLAMSMETEKSGDNDVCLLAVEGKEVLRVAPHDDESYTSGPAWLPDSSAFFFVSDVGRDVPAVARYELATHRWSYVVETGWETECLVDRTGTHLLVATNEDGLTRAVLHDPATLEVRAAVPLPGDGVASMWTFSPDGRRLAFHFSSPRVPGDVWAVDLDAGSLARLTTSACDVDTSALPQPTLHRFASFDGESVPVFLYSRGGADGGPAPVLVMIHGGPEAQARPTWNPLLGYLVERGYTVAVPNVRGSTGYGKRYQHLDDRRRRLDSVRDLAVLHGWLARRPEVDAARMALYGGSYGGYMVLAGLTLQPELWAAGIDVVGISSLVTFLERTSPYRRRVREREYGFLETDRAFLHEASPLTHVDQLRAPLFIVHGANDPRVPLSEAEQLHATLAAKGIRAELLVYPDEGHGLQKLENRLDAYPRAVDFLDEVLGTAP